MEVSRQKVAAKLGDYLQHRLSLNELVDWAEEVLMDGVFCEGDVEMLSDVVGRIGLADVRAFGLTWETCEEHLQQLGYKVNIELSEEAEAV